MSRTFGSAATSFIDTHRSIPALTEASQRTGFMGAGSTTGFQKTASKTAQNMSRMLRQRAQQDNIDDEALKQHLPCSLEAVDHLGELYVEGHCKLTSELRAAQRIPESERRLISMDYLENLEQNPEVGEAGAGGNGGTDAKTRAKRRS